MILAATAVILATVVSSVHPELMSKAEADETLKAHNAARTKEHAADMIQLTWSDELANLANQQVVLCNFAHGHLKTPSGKRVGQNIYASWGSSTPSLKPDAFVGSWIAEKRYYKFGSPGKPPACAPNEMCGHYTQVDWADTSEVGCAFARCPELRLGSKSVKNAMFVACDYYPPGNYRGKNPYEQGASCSDCGAAGDAEYGYTCKNNLCVVCEAEDTGCTCPKRDCMNGGTEMNKPCGCDCQGTGHYGDLCQKPCGDVAAEWKCKQWAGICSNPLYAAFLTQNCGETCGFSAGKCK